jgi:hypothetical protein
MAGVIINTQFSTPVNWSIGASPLALSTEITALGKETNLIADWAKGLQRPSPTSASLTTKEGEEQSLDARVFNALADAKMLTAAWPSSGDGTERELIVIMHRISEIRNCVATLYPVSGGNSAGR